MFGQVGFPQSWQISFGGMTWTGSMSAGVSTIQAIDASFNGEEFVSFAQGAFLRVMEARADGRLDDVRALLSQPVQHNFAAQKPKEIPKIANIQYATIYDARRDQSWDSVTIRIAAKTTAKKKNDFVEDWTFQRPAVTGQQQLPHECPSCGAPTTLDENGACRYCRVAISGARGGWKLVRALPPPEAPKPVGQGFARAWWAFWIIFIVLMTVVLPIGIFFAVPHSADDFGFGNGASINGPSVSSGSNSGGVTPGGQTGEPGGAPKAPTNVGYSVSGSFSGGFAGDATGKLVMPGGMAGTCATRAAAISGLNYVDSKSTVGPSQTLTVTVNLPAGSKGAGTYDLATTPMTITASYAGTPDGATSPQAQTWIIGDGTTATFVLGADASGTLKVANLQPASTAAAGALTQPLTADLTFSCS